MGKVPRPLEPLVNALGSLPTESYVLALKSAALHLQGRDQDIDPTELSGNLGSCDLGKSSLAQVLQSCGYLLKQAGKGGGQDREKLTERLDPLGFSAEQVDKLAEVLQWVKDGATVEPIPLPPDVLDAPDSDEEEGAVLDGESLHWSAIIGEQAKLERMLAKPGIQIDGVDERGYTAFHQACGNGHVDCVQVLVDAQCDTTKRNAVRLTGWQLASSMNKTEVCELLDSYAQKGHEGLAAEKDGTLAEAAAVSADEAAAQSKMEMWTVKIEAADKDMTGKFSVYVVEVWGESKRLAVTHRRYKEFDQLRKELLASLGEASEDHDKIEALPFPKKTLLSSKNSKSVQDKRSVELAQWLNAALGIVGKAPELCSFLGLSPEFIGITIVKEKKIEAYECLYEVEPMPPAKGLTTVVLPDKILLGIDMTGVQLFDAKTRALIDGEGYPYHLIRSWSWHQPTDDDWYVVLTFGEDQKGFRLQFHTDEGKEICAKMRAFATELAVNLRKESLEQMATPALQTKLAEMRAKLRRAEARESGSFKKHTKLQADITAVEEVLAKRGEKA